MDTNHIKVRPEWAKSKEDIWRDVFESPENKVIHKRITMKWLRYAAVLAVPVLLAVHFYTVTKVTATGESIVVQLPDNSTVTMNAESKISYKPLEWFLGRKVTLEGEACFEVEKGSRFSVQSGLNRVNVLGTAFNVYARGEMYRVTCLTGRVEVSVKNGKTVLNPGMQAISRGRGSILREKTASQDAIGWMQGKFIFHETPLTEVVAEIERRYGVRITPDTDLNHLYTGTFSKTERPEEALEIIGKPFGITFRVER
jgi:ferric-dicitrate binding protein FerR (iron transport regulator)